MTTPIDVMHLGRDRVICAYDVDGVIVDPGPGSTVSALDGVAPRALLLTHIHLDHAGATGLLVREHPGLPVYVHERGAPHLADPSKLLASARQLYGDDMDRLFGEVVPVPEENLRPLSGGETVEGFRVAYTPGHASHHVSYLHEASGDAYVGDVGGVRVPPYDFTVAPTPPPDLDVDRWRASIDTVEEWKPAALCLTHFGRYTDVAEQLGRIRERLAAWSELARGGDRPRFLATVEEEIVGATNAETSKRLFQAAPPEHLWLGLERYWAKVFETDPA